MNQTRKVQKFRVRGTPASWRGQDVSYEGGLAGREEKVGVPYGDKNE